MRGRRFLDLAQEVARGTREAHGRGAVIHAYYALMLECRDALVRWGRLPPKLDVHAWVRLQFDRSTDAELRRIAQALDELVRRRNKASYDLTFNPGPGWLSWGQAAIGTATDALDLLDAIETDPARRAAAVAALPP
jgi:hypothetical protein